MRTNAGPLSLYALALALPLASACATAPPKERGDRLERLDRGGGEPGKAGDAAAAATPPAASAPAPAGAGNAPAAAAARGDRDAELAELRGKVDALATHRAELERKVDALAAQRAELQRKVDALASQRQPAGAAAARDEKLADEVQRQRALIDAQARRLDAMERALAHARTAPPPERRASARAPEPRRAAPDAQGAAAPEGGREESVLALAREQEAKGQTAVAKDLYQQYVTSFPNAPAAAEAHYRLGELAFGERRYQDAIGEFGQIARTFPQSGRAPEALLRTADSMQRLGLNDEAATVLAEIPKRYPGSPAAARARQRLGEGGKPAADASAR